MGDLIIPFVPSEGDPLDSPFLENALRFLEENNPTFDFDVQPESNDHQWVPEHEQGNGEPINYEENPMFWDENTLIQDNTDDFNHNLIQDNTDDFNQNIDPDNFANMGHEDETNIIPLSVWPPAPAPFSCSYCQVLREIIHVNGNGTHTTKFEIHGRIGIICHAILETRSSNNVIIDGPPSVNHQMIDFSKQSMESVKQFLIKYCQDRKQEGFVILQDPLSTFYDALCAGLNWDKNSSADEFIPPPETPSEKTKACKRNHSDGETDVVRVPKSSLAKQRKRTKKLKLSDLANYFHLPINSAARSLGLCPTVLKKICRKHNMDRWPYRKVTSINKQIAKLQQSLREKDGEGSLRIHAQIEKLRQELAEVCSGNADR